MKKTILAAFVVLLAVMAVTCDNFSPDADKATPQYTEDGRPLVQLTINAPKMSRALTADLAKGLVDYYEVAFKDPGYNGTTNTRIYRTSWNYAKTGRIAVPAGDYDDATKAVLFAGRYNDKTLYAVGIITATSEGIGETEILPTTTSVTFTLSPLLNDVNSDPATSTFLITGPTSSDPGGHDYSSASLTDIPTVKLSGGKSYPIFAIPPHGYVNSGAGKNITAEYTVNCGASANAYYDGVIVTTGAKIVSAGYSDDESKDMFTAVTGSITAPLPDAQFPSDGKIELLINIAAVANDGLSRLAVEVPVCAISNVFNSPGVWYIRGGMNQTVLDEGKDADAPIGGAVLLAVGPVSIKGVEIHTDW